MYLKLSQCVTHTHTHIRVYQDWNRRSLIRDIDRRRIILMIYVPIYRLRKKRHSHVVDKPYRCRSIRCAVRDLKSRRGGSRELASFVLANVHNARGCIALTSSICQGCSRSGRRWTHYTTIIDCRWLSLDAYASPADEKRR